MEKRITKSHLFKTLFISQGHSFHFKTKIFRKLKAVFFNLPSTDLQNEDKKFRKFFKIL